jgi:hypothetical protein
MSLPLRNLTSPELRFILSEDEQREKLSQVDSLSLRTQKQDSYPPRSIQFIWATLLILRSMIYVPIVTHDGNYLLSLSWQEGKPGVYWFPASLIEELRPEELR